MHSYRHVSNLKLWFRVYTGHCLHELGLPGKISFEHGQIENVQFLTGLTGVLTETFRVPTRLKMRSSQITNRAIVDLGS